MTQLTELNNPPRGILVLLSGLPGVGKSTIANRIRTTLAMYHIKIFQSDLIRKQLFPEPTYSTEESIQTHEETQRQVLAGLNSADVVIYDATNLLESYRAWAHEMSEQWDISSLVVSVVADSEVVKRRLIERANDPESISDAGIEVYDTLKATAEPVQGKHMVVRNQDGFEQDFDELIAALRTLLAQRDTRNA